MDGTVLAPMREGYATIAPQGGVTLRAGGHLPSVTIAYAAYGRPWSDAPVVLVCHALTGSARVADWWGDIVGPGKLLDTEQYCVIGTNALGGCYGSTGPRSADERGVAWGSRFPVVTVQDMVRMQREALRGLGVARIAAVIGGSLGGMQALEWAAAYPDVAASAIAIGATGRLSPMGIGLNHIGRSAIRLDPKFRDGDYPRDDGPARGLAIARMVGMLSYKSADLLWQRHARGPNRGAEDPNEDLWSRFDVQGYLDHQGDKLAARLDANTYLALTKAMDLFEVGTAGYRTPTLLVAISSDWLYPPAEVRATAQALGPAARYVELESDHGHDGFLADPTALTAIIKPFLSAVVERSTASRNA